MEVVTASRDKQAAEAQTRVMVGGPGAPAVTTFTAADGGMIMSRSGSPGTREDLGEQQVEGVMAKGTRTDHRSAGGRYRQRAADHDDFRAVVFRGP